MSHPLPQTYPVLRSRIFGVLRSAKPAFLLIVILLFASSLFAFFTFAPSALADELAPAAPGSITGVVRNAQGEPQAGIEVTLYKLATNWYSGYPGWNAIRKTKTGADGIYRFTLLRVGVYRIGISDPQHIYAQTYYPAAPILEQGTDIPVIGSQLTNIDLILQPGGQITSFIDTTEAISVTQISVDLLRRLDVYAGDYWQTIQTVSMTTSSGVYSFTGLSAYTYRICAKGQNADFSISECYDNVYENSRATDLILSTGATLSGVNILLGDGADYAQISGRVVAPNSDPLGDIDVYAVPKAVAQNIYDNYSWLYANYSSVRTNSQGNYHFPMLTAGAYVLYFNDPNAQYAFEYYNDAHLPEAAVTLEVVPKQIVTDVNAQLELGGRITGAITVLGQPAGNTSMVRAELKTPLGWLTVKHGQVDFNTGNYQIGGLPAGTYRVAAYSLISDEYTLTSTVYEGYFGGSTPETATEIVLSAGETRAADVALSGATQFEGSISGRVTAGGTPLANAKVTLYRAAGNDPAVYIFTDADGRYTFNGLTNNTFWIGASDPAGVYANTYYKEQAIPILATPIESVDGKATTGIDLDLPLSGAISGRVTQRNGQPVPGQLYVSVYAPGTFNPNYYQNIPIRSLTTRTDTDGRYTIKGLQTGDYYICFSEMQITFGECFGVPYFDAYVNNKNALVKVTAGKTTTGIDLLWGQDLMFYLPLIVK